MLNAKEILELIEEVDKEKAVMALGVYALEGLKSECELLKIAIGLLGDSDLPHKEEMIKGFVQALDKKANEGLVLSEGLKDYVLK